mgnify:CR=1 FL=1|jgi:hypothetical protein
MTVLQLGIQICLEEMELFWVFDSMAVSKISQDRVETGIKACADLDGKQTASVLLGPYFAKIICMRKHISFSA